MALIRWNPWSLQSLFDDDFDLHTIPGITRLGQGLNLYETSEAFVAEAALPGIPEDKIDISIDDGVVRVTASSEEKQEETGSKRYFMTSMAKTFNYSFRLPEGLVDDQEPTAEIDNGVLTLKFQKAQKAEPKKVKVISKNKGPKTIG